jgi:hypothetical protein
MTFLFLSLLTLLVGPVLFAFAKGKRALPPVLDWAVVISITALVLFELWGGLQNGPAAMIVSVALAGLFGPTVIEYVLHRIDYHGIEAKAHMVTLVLGVTGLAIHGLLDGAALSSSSDDSITLLPAAVALHRIPVGLTMWWLLQPAFGTRTAWGAIGTVAATTCAGYALGPAVLAEFSSNVGLGFQALVSGSLLHVVFFRAHLHRHSH